MLEDYLCCGSCFWCRMSRLARFCGFRASRARSFGVTFCHRIDAGFRRGDVALLAIQARRLALSKGATLALPDECAALVSLHAGPQRASLRQNPTWLRPKNVVIGL